MNLGALESEALEVYRVAHADPTEQIGIGVLVRKLLHTPIRAARMRPGREGALVRVDAEWRIYVSDRLTATRAKWVAAHELAHWILDRHGNGSEPECDALGAAIIVPRPCYVSIRSRICKVTSVAKALGTTQSLVTLREGEVLEVPVALVQPHRTIVRAGFDAIDDPSSIGGEIVRMRIDDEPNRSALIVTTNPRPLSPSSPPPKKLHR